MVNSLNTAPATCPATALIEPVYCVVFCCPHDCVLSQPALCKYMLYDNKINKTAYNVVNLIENLMDSCETECVCVLFSSLN